MNRTMSVVMALVAFATMSFCASSPPRSATNEPVIENDAGVAKVEQTSTVMLTQALEACEDQLASTMGQHPTHGTYGVSTDKPKVVVKVVHDGAPKKCNVDVPAIIAVQTSECQDGLTCLDDKAQRALARNLSAYEHFVETVQACEAER